MVFILRNGARVAKRAALVTGGSGGIGLAIARRLAESGYAVTISGRREDKLLKAAEGLADDDLKVEAVVADVTSEEAVVELVAEHKRQWGRLDCLVNNAGIGIGQPIHEIQTKHLDLQVAVNLRALAVATRESVELLKKAGATEVEPAFLDPDPAAKVMPRWLWGVIIATTVMALIPFALIFKARASKISTPSATSFPPRPW